MNSAGYFVGKATTRVKYNLGRIYKEAGLSMDRFGSGLNNDIAYM